jgi:hypothetical protein
VALAFVPTNSVRAEELPRVYDSEMAHAVYSEGPATIPGLTWKSEDGKPAFSIEALKNGKPGARVVGQFSGKNSGTLLFSSSGGPLQRAQFSDDEGNFTSLIPLAGRKTNVKVQYIDDYGRLKSQNIQIVYENYFQFQLQEQTKKKLTFDTGASVSHLAYSQTAATANVKISEIGITPKVGLTWNLSSRLDLGASAFVTLIPIPLSKTPEGISTPRFYGVNLRIGYKVYGLRKGNIYLMTGPYFWGMIVPPSAIGLNYGVVRLTGPQLFLVGRFLTNSGRTAVGYLKAASILDGEGSVTANREYAVGGAFQITPPSAKRRFMANLDFADARFMVTGEEIKLRSLSLGVSTSF